MPIADKIKKRVEWLQALSETKKKIILCSVVAILAIIMGYFWVNSVIKSFYKIQKFASSISIPSIDMPVTDNSLQQTVSPSNK